MATAAEVKARWAYAEMRSSRFRRYFERDVYADLLEKATAGIPFCRFTAEEQSRLTYALPVAKTEAYISSVDRASRMYECKAWTEDDLLSSWALALFNFPEKRECIRYRDFYNVRPNADPGIMLDDGDPRMVAQSVPPQLQFTQSEAVIAIGRPGEYILLEGYLRSLIFMRSPDKSKRLLAWVPLPN